MCRPLLLLLGWVSVVSYSTARPPLMKAGSFVTEDNAAISGRILLAEGGNLPVELSEFRTGLRDQIESFVKKTFSVGSSSSKPDSSETVSLHPLFTLPLEDEEEEKLLFPPLIGLPVAERRISRADVDRINKALGPTITEDEISPQDPTLEQVTVPHALNLQGLPREFAEGELALPTIFSPQHMRFKIRVVNRKNVMAIQAVTLWLPDYVGPITSATTQIYMPMFELEPGTRLCLLNSTIVLQDCDLNRDLQIVCFTATSNAAFQAQYVTDLGNWNLTNTNTIECISSKDVGDGSSSMTVITRAATIGVPIAMILCLICVGLGFFYRHRTFRSKKDKIAEMTSWKSKYLDLLQTNVSDASVDKVNGLRDAKKRSPPMMIEPADGDPKGLQQQLQMVLSGTDDAPIAVQGELGRGAFGVVYKGIWKNMEVAIKTVLFQASNDLKNDPVIREACIALRVADEHLVATYHANVRHLDGKSASVTGVPALSGHMGQACQLFLVQEFCDAGTLYQWLANSRLHPCNVPDKAVIVRCALDIALGIQALHASSIVHGDLKPQNVLLTSVDRSAASHKASKPAPPAWPYAAKLTDFGLSFRLDEAKSHLSNLHVGTPFYLAPEVLGSGYLSKAADMYSLGVLLWELYHGMPPYASSNGHLVNNQCFPRFNLRSRQDAPFSYAVLTLACLSKEHTERPNIEEAVAVLEDLNNSLNGTSPSSSAYMRMTSLSRYTRGQSLQAPASMLTPGVLPPPSGSRVGKTGSGTHGGKATGTHDIAGLLMTMMQRTGLQLDKSLFKRLCNSQAGELQKLAGHGHIGLTVSPAGAEDSGQGMYVHGGNPELFNLLPPGSLANLADNATSSSPVTRSSGSRTNGDGGRGRK